MKFATLSAVTFAATLLATGGSQAETLNYYSVIKPLSGSGVSGRGSLSLDTETGVLTARIRARGLAPDMTHVQHIHGTFGPDGAPSQSVTPSFAAGADTDGDGIIELGEGVPFYGPIVLSLTDDTKTGLDGFPTAPGGKVDQTYTFDLASTTAFGNNALTDDPDDTFDMTDLLPLYLREIVLHGGFLGEGQGSNGGEADGTAGYKVVLPVAAGTIAPVPLPAPALLLIGGIAALGAIRARGRAGNTA